MKQFDLIRPGTTVIVRATSPFEARVERAIVAGPQLSVSYDVSFWQGTELKTQLVRDIDLAVNITPVMKVGFIVGDKETDGGKKK